MLAQVSCRVTPMISKYEPVYSGTAILVCSTLSNLDHVLTCHNLVDGDAKTDIVQPTSRNTQPATPSLEAMYLDVTRIYDGALPTR